MRIRNTLLFVMTLVVLLCGNILAQVPSAFMIQGLAQDADGNALANEDVEISVLLDGVPLGHEPVVTTSSAGVFRVEVNADDLTDLLLSGSGFLEVTVNGIPLSTPLLSVPYALVADRVLNDQVEDDDADPTNELQTLSFVDGKLVISGGNEISIPTGTTDADADPTNELQTISYENGILSISDGNEIELPAGMPDDDADPTNELQTISYENGILSISDGNEIELPAGMPDDDADPTNELQTISYENGILSISDGNEIELPAGMPDDDADPTNELQTISYENGILSISDGNEIELPAGMPDDDADPTNELQTISYENGILSISDGNEIELPAGMPDDDADPTNELQTISYENGILSISDGNEIELPAGMPDDDADPTNELQALRLNGNILEIVPLADGDPSITLPTNGGGNTSPWEIAGQDIYYNKGDVGIGTNNPAEKLHVVGDARVVGDFAVRSGSNNRVLLEGASSGGEIAVYDKDHRKVAFMQAADNSSWTDPQGDFGYLELKGPNGNPNVKLGFVGTASEQDRGGIGLYNEVDRNSWWLSPGPANDPDLGLYYESGNTFQKVGEFSRSTGMYSALSDKRVKENFSTLANVLTGIKSLQALSYNYIYDAEKKPEIGFIAQEVKEQFPELVNEMDGLLGVNYSGLSVVAIKAIQEQQLIIEKQQILIDQLLERVTKLEAISDQNK